MTPTPFEFYKQYVGVRKHFAIEKFDYFKYQGKKLSKIAFEKRRDRFKFSQVLNKFKFKNENESCDFLVANIIADHIWIGDMIGEEASGRYMSFKKQKEGISYFLENELEKLSHSQNIFKKRDGDYSPIIYNFLSGDISLITFSVLNYYVGFLEKEYFGNKDDFLLVRLYLKTKKLVPFLKWNDKKIRNILQKSFFS